MYEMSVNNHIVEKRQWSWKLYDSSKREMILYLTVFVNKAKQEQIKYILADKLHL